MKKYWKDIKVGDVMKDGSIVTQIHMTHEDDCCKVIYDGNREIICSYDHIFLVDISHLTSEGIEQVKQFSTFVPIEENLEILCDTSLTSEEAIIVEKFCRNETIDVKVDNIDRETYDFHFDTIKRVTMKSVCTKSEPQRVDDYTYWLTCRGIEYLMHTNKGCPIYCNGLEINDIKPMGKLPCFCISTNTGRYET